jgi:hypothetical protein
MLQQCNSDLEKKLEDLRAELCGLNEFLLKEKEKCVQLEIDNDLISQQFRYLSFFLDLFIFALVYL